MPEIFDKRGRSDETGAEPLEHIPEKYFNDLLEILTKDIPNSLPAIGVVQNVIRWKKNAAVSSDPEFSLRSPYSDLMNGTCIGIFKGIGMTIHSQDAQKQKLQDALLGTPFKNWGVDAKFAFLFEVHENLRSMVEELAVRKNLEIHHVKTLHFWMEKGKAVNLDVKCPPKVKLGPLKIEQIPYLDEFWVHRYDGSQDYLRILLERNFGIGVYHEESEMPVAWIVLNQNSCMVMLYTLETHRRKGYAELVCNAMAKRLAEMDIYPRATVLENNLSSKKLFTKMGYTPSHNVYYIGLKTK